MKTLLIDNYDSFTFNLYQLIAEVNRIPPIVIKNDAASWAVIEKLEFDNIVISPGPGRPENISDFGICKDAILKANVPILGVCLGHQGVCLAFGGEIEYADTVMHGRTSNIIHTKEGIFRNIPSPYSAVRYHSLYVKRLSDDMEKLAWTEDDIVMGAKHKTLPIWSVQFHPESIQTEYGKQLFENFRLITVDFLQEYKEKTHVYLNSEALAFKYDSISLNSGAKCLLQSSKDLRNPYKVHYRRLILSVDAESVFMSFYRKSKVAYWLDSALDCEFSRFSYMGDASGPHAEIVSYRVSDKQVKVQYQDKVEVFNESIFDYLDSDLKSRYIHVDDLPFDFNLGYVGYFGYEIKADCDFDSPYNSNTPDACFVFSDRAIVFDHKENTVYLLCYDDHSDRALNWLDEMEVKLNNTQKAPYIYKNQNHEVLKKEFRLSESEYLEKIKISQDKIKKGESYEVCLTNMISLDVEIDDLNTYRELRHSNPAPYASYLKFPELTIMSSSPEKFLTVDSCGVVESKPIKGTRKRGETIDEDKKLYKDLSTNEKDKSENLMIVDLLRNDLGRVCDIGSVYVSKIFDIESYATVHQLVSTVRGRLKKNLSGIDCIRALFPGGSMTGAPKKRTMEIIDKLEAAPRGVYSGAIGFLSLNGSVDMSIAIRTIVKTDENVTIGVGGAVTDLSDPNDELEEMLLKSKILVSVLSKTRY